MYPTQEFRSWYPQEPRGTRHWTTLRAVLTPLQRCVGWLKRRLGGLWN